jgi:hypothetical protein
MAKFLVLQNPNRHLPSSVVDSSSYMPQRPRGGWEEARAHALGDSLLIVLMNGRCVLFVGRTEKMT